MIYYNGVAIDTVLLDEGTIDAVYAGDDLLWHAWKSDNLWSNTYVTKQFIGVNGQTAVSTSGDKYEVYNGVVVAGETIKLQWSDIAVGSTANYPAIRVSFYNSFGKFIYPRLYTVISKFGNGRLIFNVPDEAVSVDIRIDDQSSERKQCFYNFEMYKN